MMVERKLKFHGKFAAVVCASVLLAGGAARAATMLPESLEEVDYREHVYEFFGEYCFDCHSANRSR